MVTGKLKTARRNTAILLVILYVGDVFWFLMSRSGFVVNRSYEVAEFDLVSFVALIVASVALSLVAVVSAYILRPLPKIKVSGSAIYFIIFLAILLNILSVIVVDPQARYRGGQFTALSWMIYTLANAFSLATVMMILRENSLEDKVSKKWIVAFLVSYGFTIDGMASALTLFVFIYLILDVRKISFRKALILGLFATILFTAGFYAKFDEVPNYVTPSFMMQWAISRFSIQAEQMYTYTAGDSIIGSEYSYLELVGRDFGRRFNAAIGESASVTHPRNLSEATRFDMHKSYDNAGSSAGALLGTVYLGPFFFVPPLFYAFLFIQHFYGVSRNLSIASLVAYAFAFKVLHANFSLYFVVMSGPFISAAVFLITCSLVFSSKTSHFRCRSNDVSHKLF